MNKKIISLLFMLILVLSSFNVFAHGGPVPPPPDGTNGAGSTVPPATSPPPKQSTTPEQQSQSSSSTPYKDAAGNTYGWGKDQVLVPGDGATKPEEKPKEPEKEQVKPMFTPLQQDGKEATFAGRKGTFNPTTKQFTSEKGDYTVIFTENGAVESIIENNVNKIRIRDGQGNEIGTYKVEEIPAAARTNPATLPTLALQLRENGLSFEDKTADGTYSDDGITVKYDGRNIVTSNSDENTEVAVDATTGNPVYYQEGNIKFGYSEDHINWERGQYEFNTYPARQIIVDGEQRTAYHLGQRDGKDIYFDSEDGSLRDANGKPLSDDEADAFMQGENKEKYERVYTAVNKKYELQGEDSISYRNLKRGFKSLQEALAPVVAGIVQFIHYYNLYSGLSAYSSLFLKGDDWNKWRDKVEKAFCDTILLGGTQCWTSKLCQQYIDSSPGQGTLIVDTAGGPPRAIAHVEGEKSLPVEVPSGNQWVYKVTYHISNTGEERRFNVKFKGDKIAFWFNAEDPDRVLKPGMSASRTAANPILKVSSNNYNTVCLVFAPSIRSFNGRTVDELCSQFSQYDGAATMPYKTEEEKAKDKKKEDEESKGYPEGEDV